MYGWQDIGRGRDGGSGFQDIGPPALLPARHGFPATGWPDVVDGSGSRATGDKNFSFADFGYSSRGITPAHRQGLSPERAKRMGIKSTLIYSARSDAFSAPNAETPVRRWGSCSG